MGRPDAAICFVCFGKEAGVFSYTYRLWAQGTSFYFKARNLTTAVKVSVHGPDPRHGQSGFKLALDGAAEKARQEARYKMGEKSPFKWFPGNLVEEGVKHVIRIRIPWDVMQKGSPSGPVPTTSKGAQQHLVLASPGLLKAADVDIYVSETGAPYWPGGREAIEKANAGMNPLRNEAGQILTAVSSQVDVFQDPTLAAVTELEMVRGEEKKCRSILMFIGSDNVCWALERIVSESMFDTYEPDKFVKLVQVEPSVAT